MTRDEAAASVGISRKLAAFHLDKLVDAGLLRAHYASPGGVRRVGRAPKVYEPSGADVRVSIPQRGHGLLAEHPAGRGPRAEGGGERAGGGAAGGRGARPRPRRGGEPPRRGGRLGAERALTRAAEILERHGFEPDREAPARLRLRNCPFHAMAGDDPELVCGVNHAFLSGSWKGSARPRSRRPSPRTPGTAASSSGRAALSDRFRAIDLVCPG